MATLPTFVSNGATATATTGTLVPDFGAGHVLNDIALLMIETAREAVTLSDTQGFVEITGSPVVVGTPGNVDATQLSAYWVRCTSDAMIGPTIEDPGDHVVARISIWRGCRVLASPIHIISTPDTATDTAVSFPAGATRETDVLIVNMMAHGTDAAVGQFTLVGNADLTNVTERGDAGAAGGNGGGLVYVSGGKAAIGAFQATTGTLLSSVPQARMTIGLLPPEDPPRRATDWLDPMALDNIWVEGM